MTSDYQGCHTFVKLNVQGHSQLSVPACLPLSFWSLGAVSVRPPYNIKQQCCTLTVCVHVNKNPAPVFLGVSTFLSVFTIPWHPLEKEGEV